MERKFLQARCVLSYYDDKHGGWIDEIVRTETIKVNKKQNVEEFHASDSVEAYACSFGDRSFEITLTNVDPDQKEIFDYVWNKQQKSELQGLPNLTVYSYHSVTGAVTPMNKFRSVYIEEISEENNSPFEVKMAALKTVE